MNGKGGGSVDTSGLEQATQQAIKLQKQIYNQTRDDVQPWYDMGVGSVNLLSDLLGVSGGSVQSREQLYNDLLPQYTSQVAAEYTGPQAYRDSEGNIIFNDSISQGEMLEAGYRPHEMGSQESQSIVDYDALNAAIDSQLAGQTTPENYGSLLETFGMDKFEEDPGYQFRQDEANKALERQMAAQGITLGGGGFGEINPTAYRAMEELNQDLASQEYGNSYNRYVQDQLNTFNMLMGASGMGQNSTGILATGGQNYATNVGNLQTGLAGAQLNADLAGQAQQGSMFSTLLGAAPSYIGLF